MKVTFRKVILINISECQESPMGKAETIQILIAHQRNIQCLQKVFIPLDLFTHFAVLEPEFKMD
jgi:hypothetical protein